MTKGADKLYRRVCDAILGKLENGEFELGDRLPPEREMAEAFAVSRTTVREAMVALEMLGIVEMRKGSGIYIASTKRDRGHEPQLDVGGFELMESRRIFEVETAALAATRIDEETLQELDELLIAMTDQDELRAEVADREFHMAIARATGNGAMVATTAFLWDMRERSALARTVLHRGRGEGLAPRVKEHAAVLEALRARNPDAARAAMQAHLNSVIDHLLRKTESDELAAVRNRSEERRRRLMGSVVAPLGTGDAVVVGRKRRSGAALTETDGKGPSSLR